MVRFAVAGCCLLSLPAGLAVGWLGWRSYRVHDRMGHSTAAARYTLHSDRGRLTLAGPPPRGPPAGEARACELLARARNADYGWSTYESFRSAEARRLGQGPTDILPRTEPRPGTPSLELFRSFNWRGGMTSGAVRPLLRALDDPDRFVVAHQTLRYLRQKSYYESTRRRPDGVTVVTTDGLVVELRDAGATEQPPEAANVRQREFPNPGSIGIDALQRDAIRNIWHDRLDVPLGSAPHWPFLAALYLPSLTWAGVRVRRARVGRRRERMGLCLACGYDLRHSPGNCPECGASVARAAP